MRKTLMFYLVLGGLLFGGMFPGKPSAAAAADKEKKTYETINALVIGDRVLDIAVSLGVMPKAISVRASQWEKAFSFPSKLIGCPVKITEKDLTILPSVIDKMKIDTVLIEDNPEFCLLVKSANPMKAVNLLKNKKVKIVTFKFSGKPEPTIREIASYLGKTAKGEELLAEYRKKLKETEERIPTAKAGKKVVVLHGFEKKETGRLFISAESKGFYTDRFFLEPFGCTNVSDALNVDKNEIEKGVFAVTDLSLLSKAAPDVIVLFGAVERLKKEIAENADRNAEFRNIPAVKNGLLLDKLPYSVGSDIVEYPNILSSWIDAFRALK